MSPHGGADTGELPAGRRATDAPSPTPAEQEWREDPLGVFDELVYDPPLESADPHPEDETPEPSPVAVRRGAVEHPRRERHIPPAKGRRPSRPLANWSLNASMFGLSMSWFMPWALPVSLLGIVLGVIALTRSWEQRTLAGWGVGLGLTGTASAVFWIFWIVDRLTEVAPL